MFRFIRKTKADDAYRFRYEDEYGNTIHVALKSDNVFFAELTVKGKGTVIVDGKSLPLKASEKLASLLGDHYMYQKESFDIVDTWFRTVTDLNRLVFLPNEENTLSEQEEIFVRLTKSEELSDIVQEVFA